MPVEVVNTDKFTIHKAVHRMVDVRFDAIPIGSLFIPQEGDYKDRLMLKTTDEYAMIVGYNLRPKSLSYDRKCKLLTETSAVTLVVK
jgi:hypothetical protein